MALALRDRILEHYLECLTTVNRAAGYSCDLIVEEPKPGEGNRDRQYLAVLHSGDAPTPEEDAPQLYRQWSQPFAVTVSVYAPEAVTAKALREIAGSVAADVVKALTKDANYQRDDLGLIDTVAEAPSVSLDSADSHRAEVDCAFTFRHRHLYSDPTALT